MQQLVRLVGAVGVCHAAEDVVLLSLGRFLPVPIWALYLIGIALSTTVLTLVIRRFTLHGR